MAQNRTKSRKYRRIHVRTPSGNSVVHYRKRKPKKAVCAVTRKPLCGVIRETPYKMQNTSKTKKRPQRPFGGVLSSSAMRREMIRRARKKD